MKTFIRRASLLALGTVLPCIVAAAALKVDPAKSSVSAVFKQMNVPVEAKFKKFSAQIDYDAAKPEAAKAMMEIDIPSFDLGDPEYNKEVLKKEWFNAAQFPKASFASTTITPNGSGKMNVSGRLTIKGKTADVQFPVITRKDGATTVFEGALPIKRLAFNIGEGEWKDTSMVADEVIIKFRIIGSQ